VEGFPSVSITAHGRLTRQRALRNPHATRPSAQYTFSYLVEGVGNALLVMLLVLYLLAEQSAHAPNSLRAKVDNQIQRYLVIKTAISALQGLLAYFIMGPLLNVRMAHLFGVLHCLLNYIPTAGPIIATGEPAGRREGGGGEPSVMAAGLEEGGAER
jgi:predicted PurR-regulated permease PerM